MKSRLLICILLVLLACSKEEPAQEFTPLPPIDIRPEVMELVNLFFDEGDKRGHVLDRSKLQLFIVKQKDIGYVGARGGNFKVYIPEDVWNHIDNVVKKEQIVFHEMGHSFLGRIHSQEMLPDCSSKSVMRGFPYSSTSDPKRKYYIDELFDPYTKYPSWAPVKKFNKTTLLTHDPKKWKQGAITPGEQEWSISTDKSLHISSNNNGYGSGLWKLEVPTDKVPAGATLVVNGKLKYRNIKGTVDVGLLTHPGVRDEGNEPRGASLSMYENNITERMKGATDDWVSFKLTYNCYPPDRPAMYVFLIASEDENSDAWLNDVTVDFYN